MKNKKLIAFRHNLEQAKRNLKLFNEMFPIIRMGSVEFTHHAKLLNQVERARSELKGEMGEDGYFDPL